TIPTPGTFEQGGMSFTDHDGAEVFFGSRGRHPEEIALLDAKGEDHQGLTIAIRLEPAGLPTLLFCRFDVAIDFFERLVHLRQIAIEIERELGPAKVFDVVGVNLLDEVLNGGGDAW